MQSKLRSFHAIARSQFHQLLANYFSSKSHLQINDKYEFIYF